MDFSEITVPVVPGLSRKQIEQAALEFSMMVAPECLDTPCAVPVLTIFEDRLDLFEYKAIIGKNIKGLPGITNVTDRELILSSATHKNLEKDIPYARFTVAHEFGHMILHSKIGRTGHSINGDQVMFARRSQIASFEDPEWQANQFGAAVLMPLPMMRELYLRGELNVAKVMEVFKVSEQAAKIRITQLKTGFMK